MKSKTISGDGMRIKSLLLLSLLILSSVAGRLFGGTPEAKANPTFETGHFNVRVLGDRSFGQFFVKGRPLISSMNDIAMVEGKRRVHVYSLETGLELYALPDATVLGFSKDASVFAYHVKREIMRPGGNKHLDEFYRLAKSKSGEKISHLQIETENPLAFGFRKNDAMLLLADEEGKIHLWDLAFGKELKALSLPCKLKSARYFFSQSGEFLYLHDQEAETLLAWDIDKDAEQSKSSVKGDATWPFDFPASNDRALFREGTKLNLYDTVNAKLLTSLALDDFPTAIAFRDDFSQIAFGEKTGQISLWNTEKGDLAMRLDAHGDKVQDLSFCPGRDFLLSSSRDGNIHYLNFNQKRVEKTLEMKDNAPLFVRALKADSDEIFLLNPRPEIWDFVGKKRVKPEAPKPWAESSIEWFADGKKILSRNFKSGKYEIWNLENGLRVREFDKTGFHDAVLSADGKKIFVRNGAGFAVCDAESGAEIKSLKCREGKAVSLAEDAQGGKLFVATDSCRLEIWNLADMTFEASRKIAKNIQRTRWDADKNLLKIWRFDGSFELFDPNKDKSAGNWKAKDAYPPTGEMVVRDNITVIAEYGKTGADGIKVIRLNMINAATAERITQIEIPEYFRFYSPLPGKNQLLLAAPDGRMQIFDWEKKVALEEWTNCSGGVKDASPLEIFGIVAGVKDGTFLVLNENGTICHYEKKAAGK